MKKFFQLEWFTRKEEKFNGIVNIVGAAISIILLAVGVVFASIHGGTKEVVNMTIYGLSLIVMYVLSSIYHFLHRNNAKAVFEILEKSSYFIVIVGTYTPICLMMLMNDNNLAWVLYIIIVLFAVVGIVFNATLGARVDIINNILYILLIIIAVFFFDIWKNLDPLPLALLLSGCGVYFIGAIVHSILKVRNVLFHHGIWHIFILIGTIVQYLGILFYLIF